MTSIYSTLFVLCSHEYYNKNFLSFISR